MSGDRPSSLSSNKPLNGSGPHAAATQLADLLRDIQSFDPSDPSSAEDIGQLLKSIEQADGIAKGIDSRLDTLLQDLEGMIGVLEADRAQGKALDVQTQSRLREDEDAIEAELASLQCRSDEAVKGAKR
ncbi:hypothetical protein DACRYDRAFT_98959 [Dacryopinax primogenitus]|uniref:Uncharacterized protein n=1 Tax=Dacryopinax primogenitus (strain DJM 731) TaxID=1858805 RepID=M5GD48_DACPD|nr:uncharacterized protein DACRYDRAFT_98959 [Dacryopinax primogenitus]EJU04252.1 hypothetical protein DACRYDRAFT_98959 [Dacryopinax primogenitus]